MATHEYFPFQGGAAVYVREVATAACTLGVNLEVWTADRRGGGAKVSSETSHKSSAGPPVVRFPSDGRLTPRGLCSLAYGWWQRRRQLRQGTVAVMSVGAQMIFFCCSTYLG